MGKAKRNDRTHNKGSAPQSKPHGQGIKRRQHSQNGKGLKTQKLAIASKSSSPKPKIPFGSSDRVLLVGEGDFSFSLSLARHHKVGAIVATSYDDEVKLKEKYPQIDATLQFLRWTDKKMQSIAPGSIDDEDHWEGFSSASEENDSLQSSSAELKCSDMTVLHNIDATSLSKTHKKVLSQFAPFTKIVFNFPHTGGLSTDVNRQVRANQELLVNFFNAAKPLLATRTQPAKPTSKNDDDDGNEDDYDAEEATAVQEDEIRLNLASGQILVTLFEGEPYTLWNIRDLARHCGLQVIESFKFPWAIYPGYKHARTVGDIATGKDRSDEGKRKGAWRGEERDARCYVLGLKGEIDNMSRKKRKRGNGNESEESS